MDKTEMRKMLELAKKDFYKRGGKVKYLDPQPNGKVVSKFRKAANPTIDPETNERPKGFIRSNQKPDATLK